MSDTQPEPVTATIPGADPSTFVTLTLANPLGKKDRVYLGLPEDAETEVGSRVRVNKNGARSLIGSGYVTVDPEDHDAVRNALSGDSDSEAPNPSLSATPPAESVKPGGEVTPPAESGNETGSTPSTADSRPTRSPRP